MVKFSVPKPKKAVAILAILSVCLLVGLGAYWFLIRSDSTKEPTQLSSSQKTAIDTGPSKDSCDKSMTDINKANPSTLPAKDAAGVYNFQGNCYYENGEYKQALESYKKWRDACKMSSNPRCASIADAQIKAVENTIKTGER